MFKIPNMHSPSTETWHINPYMKLLFTKYQCAVFVTAGLGKMYKITTVGCGDFIISIDFLVFS